ncbi:hypothetical protein PAPYR_11849 [Paratrimastix pyriformis]|uniref:EF-hand domain-containing protein n=1 Tax=Paratrimastix pyriformis TaxID=342808 RepID=A0ABQ8U2Y1_9EUKA|nr:hypothetical protein PAPYR_11849 [Paratrimastix pyriformis]|eukprot:GAFH01001793.1.p1 GENE.GAFH01001793.1~~GAFH01001793.1.p1  ORF type:complete len:447 (+),score=36.12 GAFH01001793.1:23-1363(+)
MGTNQSKMLENAADVVQTSLKFMDPIQALFQAVGPLGIPATALFYMVKGIFVIIKRHKETHEALAGLIGVLTQLELIMEQIANCNLPETDTLTHIFRVFENLLNRAHEILEQCEKRSGIMNIIRDSLAELRYIEKSLREEIPIVNTALSAAILVRIQEEQHGCPHESFSRGCIHSRLTGCPSSGCITGVVDLPGSPQSSPGPRITAPSEEPPAMAIDAVCFLLKEFPRQEGHDLEKSFKVGEVMVALQRHFRPIWREQYAERLQEAIDLNGDGKIDFNEMARFARPTLRGALEDFYLLVEPTQAPVPPPPMPDLGPAPVIILQDEVIVEDCPLEQLPALQCLAFGKLPSFDEGPAFSQLLQANISHITDPASRSAAAQVILMDSLPRLIDLHDDRLGTALLSTGNRELILLPNWATLEMGLGQFLAGLRRELRDRRSPEGPRGKDE